MDTFLSKVAEVYLFNEAENLTDYCFVFPNKRSGIFFHKALMDLSSDNVIVSPEITTISDYISSMSLNVEASKNELLFILYDVYKAVMHEHYTKSEFVNFDQFRFWADMLLNDFNDVDKYLVDAKMIFKNVKDLKEINSNFLTSEQIEVINTYWNEDRSTEPVDEFWKHIKYGNDNASNDISDRFVRLWEILYDLYSGFRNRLSDMGLCYSGMMYRDAVDKLNKTAADELKCKRYIFIGFNVLSTSEIKIFERLQKLGCADFYWDYGSPIFKNSNNKATRFLSRYVACFKSIYDLGEFSEYSPCINVVGIPSNVGQTKFVGDLLSKMVDDKVIENPTNAINTAIVLPDEDLFIPLVHSIPKDFSTINITMGYPMRHTSIASLISSIISMQLRGRFMYEKMHFFYEDVFSILSHPFVRAISSAECDEIILYVNNNRKFNIEADFLVNNYKNLSMLFIPVKDIKDTREIFTYIINLVGWLKKNLNASNANAIDLGFIEYYSQAVEQLSQLSEKYSVQMLDKTIFHLIERMIGCETVNFKGEPLKGLQIMGVLETRALDFENVIILSMNDRIFPRKHYAKTFIPNALRRGYGLSTIEFQESIYAYYFYRLISKAKNVYLVYDARSGGLKSGEMSRYLHQLKYLYNSDKIKFCFSDYFVGLSAPAPLSIFKTQETMEKLSQYTIPNSGKYLSASAINKYINCPLSFYLYYIEGLQYEEEVKEYMDESTYGTIVHEVAEFLYKCYKGDNVDEVVVTTQLLNEMQNNKALIERLIVRSINKNYNKLSKDPIIEKLSKNVLLSHPTLDKQLTGEAKVLSEIIMHFIWLMLEQEKQFTPFAFIDGEVKMAGQWKITDELTINFKYIIDRIDRMNLSCPGNDYLRFVDYKTGGDKVKAKSVDALFDASDGDRPKAILQLFAYANAYAEFKKYTGAIQPYIYLLKTVNTEHLPPIKIEKKTVTDYRDYNDDFMKSFRSVLVEMFNPDVPFKQAEDSHACKYCKFISICGKTVER